MKGYIHLNQIILARDLKGRRKKNEKAKREFSAFFSQDLFVWHNNNLITGINQHTITLLHILWSNEVI